MLLIWVCMVAVVSALPSSGELSEEYGVTDNELEVTDPEEYDFDFDLDEESQEENIDENDNSIDIDLPEDPKLEDDKIEGSDKDKIKSKMEPEMENEFVLMGDMLVKKSKLDMFNNLFERNRTRAKRQASAITLKWPENIIHYYLDASINAAKETSISAAMKYISSRTCINFVQSKTSTNRIKFFSGNGCYSSIGRVGGEQVISIGNGCESVGTVAHEIMHAIGIFHMQSRHDRDKYVKVNLKYVEPGMEYNFDKLAASDTVDIAPYDLGSVMHYGAKSFTPRDKFSIASLNKQYMYTMGSDIISFFDIKRINDLYKCKSTCPASKLAKCKSGGVPNPRTCTTCNCPMGYAGPLCGQRPAGCGKVLNAQPQWKTANVKLGKSGLRNDFSYCNYWVKAPKGNKSG